MSHEHAKLVVWLSAALVIASPAFAGDTSIIAGNETIEGLGGSTEVAVTTDASFDLSGFSYGLCEPAGGLEIPMDGVSPGADVASTNGGAGPDFFAPAQAPLLTPGGLGDHTVGCVISFSGMDVLAAGTNEVAIAAYWDVSMVEATYALDFCDTLGTPLVITTLVDASGAGFGPTPLSGSVTVIAGPAPFKFTAPMVTFTTGAAASLDLSIAEISGAMTGSQGFSFGLAIGGTQVTLTADAPTGPLAATNMGAGPDFIGSNLDPAGGPGYTAGVVVSFAGMDTLVVADGNGSPVITLTFDVGGAEGDNIPLTWSDDLGDPVVVNTVVVDGIGENVDFCDGRIDIIEMPPEQEFIRGDCNDDGLVNIADGIHIIVVYVVGGPALGNCEEACDVNDDDMNDLSDAIYVLNYRLMGGPAPTAPFPECGTQLGSDCQSHSTCREPSLSLVEPG